MKRQMYHPTIYLVILVSIHKTINARIMSNSENPYFMTTPIQGQTLFWTRLIVLVLVVPLLVEAQCVGVYNSTQLQDAINSANLYGNTTPTVITLCSDFNLGSEATNMPNGFAMSNRNIRLRCNKTVAGTMTTPMAFATRQPRCIFDGENKLNNIFSGTKTKLSVFGANFINAGLLIAPFNFIMLTSPVVEYGTSAWNFIESTVILQQCSFINNTSTGGGAIDVSGTKSRLIIRGGTRTSQNLFYNNTGLDSGAILFRGEQFKIGGMHTNFSSNQGDYVGAIRAWTVGNRGQINITGSLFLENLGNRIVRTVHTHV
jgi:predicted outer membrane repeat protein